MSNTRYKLHWITALIESLKTVKEAIIPLVILIFANGLNRNPGTGLWYVDYLSFLIFAVLIISLLITGIIKWKRFEYWFEDDELRIESGLFVKKKRYIPFERIQSLDYTEGILHRPLKLVKVKVETAGGASGKAEAELTAITREAARQVEEALDEAKRRKKGVQLEEGLMEEMIEEVPKTNAIFKMSTKELLILATTSGRVGFIFSGVAIFLSQFAELIPFEWMYNEFFSIIKFGLLIISIIVFIGLFIVWLVSVGMAFLSYYQFTVLLDEADLMITRGLLEKKRMTVPLNRVQSVRVIQNPLKQLFGYATVVIDSAGGSGAEMAKINLFPLVKKDKVQQLLTDIFPELNVNEPTKKLPNRGRRFYYRVDFLWMVPVIGLLTYFFFPYGLFAILIVPVIVLFGLWQHRSAAFQISGNQLTLRYRTVSLQTTYLLKKRIQSMEMKQNYFHRRKKVATIGATVKSGAAHYNPQVHHMEQRDAEAILAWYEPNMKSEQIDM